jgi:phosphatidylcholine synthase
MQLPILGSEEKGRILTLRAWAVHFYTSIGLVLGYLALLAVFKDQPLQAALYLGLAAVIDGTDGFLARRCDVYKWTPNFDGRKLDDIIDYLNYVLIPIYAAYHFELVTGPWVWSLPFALLAAVYGFSNEAAKTDDGYFTGFPNYWNGIVFYLYLLKTPSWASGLLFLFFGIMVFIPIKYIYLSQTRHFRKLNVALTLIWLGMVAHLVANFFNPDPNIVCLSLFYPAYYFGMSFYLHFRRPRPIPAPDSEYG